MSDRDEIGDGPAVALEIRRPRGASGHAPITATREIGVSQDRAYEFIADLGNHQHLADRRLRLRRLEPCGRAGQILIAGPLGLRRTATTQVTTEEPGSGFGGIATVGLRTRGRVDWILENQADAVRVSLRAQVLSVGPIDRVLLVLGGRRWLRRRFEDTLARLDAALAADTTPARTFPAPALAG